MTDETRFAVSRAVLTCGAVVLAIMALDDITTDTDTSFVLERVVVAACGLWLAFITHQLWSRGRRGLASVSLVLLVLAAAAQPLIGQGVPRPQLWLSVTATAVTGAALIWFLIVAAVLAGFLGSGRITGRRNPT